MVRLKEWINARIEILAIEFDSRGGGCQFDIQLISNNIFDNFLKLRNICINNLKHCAKFKLFSSNSSLIKNCQITIRVPSREKVFNFSSTLFQFNY